MNKMNLQLFAESAEAVQGKQIVYLFRVFENAANAAGTVIAFTTENENSASADADTIATKDGSIQKPGAVTVEITGTALVLKGDETAGEKLRDAMLHNKLVECWEADLSNPRSGDNKFAGTYYQGYLTEWTKTSNAEDFSNLPDGIGSFSSDPYGTVCLYYHNGLLSKVKQRHALRQVL